VGLERGPLSLMSITKELLGRKSGGSGLETRDYGLRDPKSDGRLVGIVRSRTQAREFSFSLAFMGVSAVARSV
jgi:hypothetical protein